MHQHTTIDLAILAALERLADEQAQSAVACMSTDDAAGVSDFRRACTAYSNAAKYYRAGVRPDVLNDGRIRLQRAAGSVHTVTMRPGQMPMCSCRAGESMHWPLALCIALEVAHDDLSRFDGGDEEGNESDPPPPPAPPGASLLTARLTATAQILDTMRAAQNASRMEQVPADRTMGVRLAQARALVAAIYEWVD